jgi:prepilin-type N-terminal cleavage/methylation domain-containing protein
MKYIKTPRSISAFSLVELSIVLIIIGLLVAGVSGGQALIKQARINALAQDIDRYMVSINTFKLAYGQLPGDFDEASVYWGTDCHASDNTICNGNGNDQIEFSTTAATDESYMVWRHLSLAETLDGTFSGARDSSSGPVISSNIPESTFKGAGFTLLYGAEYTMSGSKNTTFNSLNIGKPVSSTTISNGDFISPRDAKTLDIKIDDGNANTGKFFGLSLTASICQNSTVIVGTADSGKDYVATTNTPACFLAYKLE